MPRTARHLSASGVYHVMWRGIDKAQLFVDDGDNLEFLHLLDFVQTDDFQVLAYCLMGNHVHLLVKTDKTCLEPMQTALKRLGIRYASYFNRRYQRVGPVFQGRYKSQAVESRCYFLRVLRYIHNNPVEAHMVAQQGDYQWSSYNDYFSKRDTVICKVYTDYALQLHDLDWLRTWHSQTEKNIRGILERSDSATVYQTDDAVRDAVNAIIGCGIGNIAGLPAEKRTTVIRHLVIEEGVRIIQLSRLTGISKGEIRRCLL